eukprot:878460-Rhodomonas_salina.1
MAGDGVGDGGGVGESGGVGDSGEGVPGTLCGTCGRTGAWRQASRPRYYPGSMIRQRLLRYYPGRTIRQRATKGRQYKDL